LRSKTHSSSTTWRFVHVVTTYFNFEIDHKYTSTCNNPNPIHSFDTTGAGEALAPVPVPTQSPMESDKVPSSPGPDHPPKRSPSAALMKTSAQALKIVQETSPSAASHLRPDPSPSAAVEEHPRELSRMPTRAYPSNYGLSPPHAARCRMRCTTFPSRKRAMGSILYWVG